MKTNVEPMNYLSPSHRNIKENKCRTNNYLSPQPPHQKKRKKKYSA